MEIIFLEFRGIYRHQDFGDRSESETDYSDASTLNSWVTCKVKMIGWGCLLMRGTFGESWLILLGSKNLNFCESFALANQHLVPPVTYVLSEADGQTRCSWNRAVVGILVGILTNRTSNWAWVSLKYRWKRSSGSWRRWWNSPNWVQLWRIWWTQTYSWVTDNIVVAFVTT